MSHHGVRALLLTLVVAMAVKADTTLYSTSFESPTFSTGALAGQNGWNVYGTGTTSVVNSFAYSGSQSVFVNNNATQSGPYYALSSTGPLIQESAEIAIFASTTQSGWQLGATGPGLIGYLGGIDINAKTNAIRAITQGQPIIGVFPRATTFDSTAWHNVTLFFNLNTQTYSISLDGVTLDSNVPFCGTNSGGCTGATVTTYGDGIFDTFGATGANDSGYLDNYSVTLVNSAPEPASIGLLLMGAGLIITLRWRRLQRHALSFGSVQGKVREQTSLDEDQAPFPGSDRTYARICSEIVTLRSCEAHSIR